MKIESEKLLERKLKRYTERHGGMCIKLECNYLRALPDRMLLLPGGRSVYVEVKTTGEKPSRAQAILHRKMIKLGFEVHVIDTSDQIKALFNE